MDKKYKLTDETTTWRCHILHRIEALRDFAGVKKGDKGGWIAKEENLSHQGDCWVADEAKVFDDARVLQNAFVCGNSSVFSNALISENAIISEKACVSGIARISSYAWIFGHARVSGNALISENALIGGNARISSNAYVTEKADYITIDNIGSHIVTLSAFKCADGGVKIITDYFSGTLDEFEKVVEEKHGDNKYGREYKAVIELIKIHFDLKE